MTKARFVSFSAVLAGIKDIKEVMAAAEGARRVRGQRTILFVDEIHRFNKAQQDAFLPHVETGSIVLIGATTENPSFEVNAALLSRSRVFVLRALEEEEILSILARAVADVENGLGAESMQVAPDALALIARAAGGDARSALNLLELAASSAPIADDGQRSISRTHAEQVIQRRMLLYDKGGEEHYNIISALHKSMRNSDPDAALYWLARMVEAGEDPLYIARRLVRFASEDVGMADPQALTVCVAAKDAVHFLGMPEGNTALAQAAVYLATAPKSNAILAGYGRAADDARDGPTEPVPLHLRNAATKLMRDLDYGRGYQYAHDAPDAVTPMTSLPDSLAEPALLPADGPGVREGSEASAGRVGRDQAGPPGLNPAIHRQAGCDTQGCRPQSTGGGLSGCDADQRAAVTDSPPAITSWTMELTATGRPVDGSPSNSGTLRNISGRNGRMNEKR